jgi:acyl carrier protein
MATPAPEEIQTRVRRILHEDFKVDPAKMLENATFRGDMAMDSLDVVDLVFFVQKEFGIKARVEEYQDVKTLGRLVDHLHKKLVAMAAAAPPA